MLNITSQRQWKTDVYYRKEYFVDESGGLSFPCDEYGNLEPLNEAAQQNYEYALSHPEKYAYRFGKVQRYESSYMENARGICKCGTEIELYNAYCGACNCPNCGQWYNLFGEEILSPELWEEEI